MDRFYWFVVSALAVWRVTHLLTSESGPGEVFVRIRRGFERGRWGAVVGCFYCASVWVAAPFAAAVGSSAGERVLLWLALSGAACVVETLTTRAAPAVYWEEENDHALLRKRADQPGPSRDAA